MIEELIFIGTLTKADQLLFSAYLGLVALEDGRRFVSTDERQKARIELFELNDLSMLESETARDQEIAKIAYVASAIQALPQRENVWFLSKPARLGPLREILRAITNGKATSAAVPPNLTNAAVSDEKQLAEHRKLEYWLGLLVRHQADRMPRELQGLKGNSITLFPAQNQVCFQHEHGWQNSILDATRCPIMLPSMAPNLPEGVFTMSYSRFRWELCMALSRGILLPGIASMPTYTLLQWPDFGVLGSNPEHMKLSALFHGRSLSIANASMLAKLPKDVVIAFINGCAALGLLKNCPQELLGRQIHRMLREPVRASVAASEAPKHAHGRFGSLLGKLRNAFGLTG